MHQKESHSGYLTFHPGYTGGGGVPEGAREASEEGSV